MASSAGASTAVTARPLFAFATAGAGSGDEDRLRLLLGDLPFTLLPFAREAKRSMYREIVRAARSRRYPLLVMEGTGLAGGLALIWAHLRYRTRYVVSSGDAVAPFLSARRPLARLLFACYERRLCAGAAGFIGWSPYLAGRALTLGAPRAMTAAGWAPFPPAPPEAGERLRRELGIPSEALVFGIAGSLAWSARHRYCYGMELVQALRRGPAAAPVHVLIVGAGEGRAHLERAAGTELGRRVHLVGAVPRAQVPEYLAAMDVGSLPQSVDGVGSFRYSTKLSEYLAAQLPYCTTRIPAAYDLDSGGLWRLPGASPWDPVFVEALAGLMASLRPAEVAAKRRRLPSAAETFDRERQTARVQAFLAELLPEAPTPESEE